MTKIDVTYALPSSRLCLDSTLTFAEDKLLEPGKKEGAPKTTVALEVSAGPRNQTLAVDAGWLINTGISLETTDDGRLKSTDLELSGQAGKVVLGVVGAATAAAGGAISMGLPGLSLLKSRTSFAGKGKAEEPSPVTVAREREEAAFHEAKSEEAALRDRYRALVGKTVAAIAAQSEALIAQPESVDKPGLKKLSRLEDLLRRYHFELDRLNELFRAWRATTLSTRVETHQHYVELDLLRDLKVKDGQEPNLTDAKDDVKLAWNKLGVIATVDPVGTAHPVKKESRDNEILVRFPRVAMISVYERDTEGKAVLRERKPQLVMDGSCETKTVKLRRSIWAKRSVKLGFSELGTLTSFKHEAESAAAGAAATAGQLPATVASSLESAAKSRKELTSLRNAGLAERLDSAKQEAEAKQQELTLAGLTATAKDHAKLESLKQEVAILEQEEKKAGEKEETPDPTVKAISDLKKQVELQMLEAWAQRLKQGP
jgi:hypothetical protein